MKPVFSITIPEYDKNKLPDYVLVGKKLDSLIKERFLGKDVAIRCLSLQDHIGKSLDDLIAIIEKTGTDKYDPYRKMSVAHDFYTEKGVEIFATPVSVTSDMDLMADVIKDFFEGAVKDRGYSIKVDLIVVYNTKLLKAIPIKYNDGIGKDAFLFRKPDNKSKAVIGFIKII